jgi:hypothetical protein
MSTQATSQTEHTIAPDQLREEIITALRSVYDPELPVNIYDLGLIYRVEVNESGVVWVDMTLTTPSCPEAQSLPAQAEEAVRAVPGVSDVILELVWDPPWGKELLTEEVKMLLGIF